jgi:hypothetical protein
LISHDSQLIVPVLTDKEPAFSSRGELNSSAESLPKIRVVFNIEVGVKAWSRCFDLERESIFPVRDRK